MRFSLKTMLWGILLLALIMVSVLSLIPKRVRVQTHAIAKGNLRVTVSEDGKTRIREKYTVSAPVSGRLSRIELNEGDFITEETLLAVILPGNPEMLDKRTRAQAHARVQAAEAAVSRAESRERQAKIDLELNERKLERAKGLRSTNAISQEEFDIVNSNVLSASQAIETATFESEIARYERKLANAAADQFGDDDSTVNVDPFEIHSPISGRVLRVLEKSSTVLSVGTPFIEIGDPRNIEMVIDVLSTDAVKIKSGAEVTIEHWGGERPLKGHVRVVEPGAFTKVSSLGVEEQRVNVIADFNEPPEKIRSLGDGYRVEARITVKQVEDVLLVPNNALFRHEGQWHVLVVDVGTAALRKVELGLQNESHSEILSGLSENDRVIEYPDDELQPGTKIEADAINATRSATPAK